MGAVAAAALLRKDRQIVDAYLEAGATTRDKARPDRGLGIHEGLALEKLRRRAVLRPGEDGGLYLDLPTWGALRSLRRRLALVLLILAIGAAALVAFLRPNG